MTPDYIYSVINVALVLLTSSRLGVAEKALRELVVDKPEVRVIQGENGTLECRTVPADADLILFEWRFGDDINTAPIVYQHYKDDEDGDARGHLVNRSSHSYDNTTGVYALHIYSANETVDTGVYHCQNSGGAENLKNRTYFEVLLPTTATTTIDTTTNDQNTVGPSVRPGPPETLQQRLQEKDEEELETRAQAAAMQRLTPLDMDDSPLSPEQRLGEIQELQEDQDVRVVAKKDGAAGRQHHQESEGET